LNSHTSRINTRASISRLQHAQTHMWFQPETISVPIPVRSLEKKSPQHRFKIFCTKSKCNGTKARVQIRWGMITS
jgi:hypothetical protein